MVNIVDESGKVVSSTGSLRALRAYIGKNLVKGVGIWEMGREEGKLVVTFESGAFCDTNFASFVVLKESVRHWRNLYGVPLTVNCECAGEVAFKNPALL